MDEIWVYVCPELEFRGCFPGILEQMFLLTIEMCDLKSFNLLNLNISGEKRKGWKFPNVSHSSKIFNSNTFQAILTFGLEIGIKSSRLIADLLDLRFNSISFSDRFNLWI